jgi:hypothetical protein
VTTIVTMRHVRQAKMCSKGARAFFQRHNLDWPTFVRQGLPADIIAATGDTMALKVVEVARGQR